MILQQLLINHEGERLKPYRDSMGKLTIGIGRNLDDVGITKEEARYLLENDIIRVVRETEYAFSWITKLSYPRKCVVYCMVFNMGLAGLLKFKKFLSALELGQYERAANEMLNSKWAAQVGKRATDLAEIMRTDLIIDIAWPQE